MCVCTKHQNPKLMLDALGSTCSFDLSVLMAKVFCDTSNKWCMLHRCEKCPGKPNLDSFLLDKLTDEDEIKFSQWVSVDRAEHVTHVLPREEFIDKLAQTIDDLTAHHVIT